MADEIELNQEEERAIAAVEPAWGHQGKETAIKDIAGWQTWNKKLIEFAKLEKGMG